MLNKKAMRHAWTSRDASRVREGRWAASMPPGRRALRSRSGPSRRFCAPRRRRSPPIRGRPPTCPRRLVPGVPGILVSRPHSRRCVRGMPGTPGVALPGGLPGVFAGRRRRPFVAAPWVVRPSPRAVLPGSAPPRSDGILAGGCPALVRRCLRPILVGPTALLFSGRPPCCAGPSACPP